MSNTDFRFLSNDIGGEDYELSRQSVENTEVDILGYIIYNHSVGGSILTGSVMGVNYLSSDTWVYNSKNTSNDFYHETDEGGKQIQPLDYWPDNIVVFDTREGAEKEILNLMENTKYKDRDDWEIYRVCSIKRSLNTLGIVEHDY